MPSYERKTIISGVARVLGIVVVYAAIRYHDSASSVVPLSPLPESTPTPARPTLSMHDAERLVHGLLTMDDGSAPAAPGVRVSRNALYRLAEVESAQSHTMQLSVAGDNINASVAYTLAGTDGTSLNWRTHLQILTTHGRRGWYVDGIAWTDRRLESVVIPGRPPIAVSSSTQNSDGTVLFRIGGYTWEWSNDGNFRWRVATVATPTPQRITIAPPQPMTRSNLDTGPSGEAVPPEDLPPNAPPPSEAVAPDYGSGVDCDDETIDDVHRDGAVVTTIEGSVYLVNDIDVVTTSIWLSSEEIKACSDDGMHYVLTKDDESVSATKVQP